MRAEKARRSRRGVGAVSAAIAIAALPLGASLADPANARGDAAMAPISAARSAGPVAPAAPARPPPPRLPTERQTITSDAGLPVHAYPPVDGTDAPVSPSGDQGAAAAARPLVVMLHGMCSDVLPTCDAVGLAGREGSWLVCPTGNARCGGAADWYGSGEEKAASIDAAIAALDRAWGAFVDHRGDVLAGFSRGAFVARDVIYARPGRYRGAILVGASLSPDPDRFEAAGIRRVVLAAGDYDGARPAMQRAAARLSAGGVPARFVSLGRIGHWLPEDFEDRMREALRWIRE